MPSIKRYQKVTDDFTTHEITPPPEPGFVIEHATIEGWTYVAVEGELPEQSNAITVEDVELTDALRDALRAASPQIAAINRDVVSRIRQHYSVDDEIKALRLAPSDETAAWNDYVEECREWGEGRKMELGL